MMPLWLIPKAAFLPKRIISTPIRHKGEFYSVEVL